MFLFYYCIFVNLSHALVTHLVIVHYCVINVVKMGLVGDLYMRKCASSESILIRSYFLVPCHFYLSRQH
jgi:hypothetical protein